MVKTKSRLNFSAVLCRLKHGLIQSSKATKANNVTPVPFWRVHNSLNWSFDQII